MAPEYLVCPLCRRQQLGTKLSCCPELQGLPFSAHDIADEKNGIQLWTAFYHCNDLMCCEQPDCTCSNGGSGKASAHGHREDCPKSLVLACSSRVSGSNWCCVCACPYPNEQTKCRWLHKSAMWSHVCTWTKCPMRGAWMSSNGSGQKNEVLSCMWATNGAPLVLAP